MVRTTPGQKIPLDKLQSTLSALEKLEEKAKDELSLRESIAFLSEKLQSALKKGYSYQDLAEILVQQEIKISAATLKQYLTELEKEKRSRPRGGKSKKNHQITAATENLPASSDKVQEDKSTVDTQQPEVDDAVDAAGAATLPQVQSTTGKKQTSEKGTKTTRRQAASASQPKDDLTSPPKDNLANEFNQY